MSGALADGGGPQVLLRVTGLIAGYSAPVVGPSSFSLSRGDVTGLWGPNGAGKSTLLNAITRGARVVAGRIERAPGLRIAFQEQRPVRLPSMPLTGRDLLRCVDAQPTRAPGAVASVLDRRIDTLSGGQYQLLCVWAALGGPHDLVLLDEPTNNLDPRAEALLGEMLATERDRRSVLLVSHERGFIKSYCSRLIEVTAWSAKG